MNIKEKLGCTIQSLKDKLSATDLQVQSHCETISKQEETIKQQSRVINDLNIRVECNKEVATVFMKEVLDEGDDSCEDETMEG